MDSFITAALTSQVPPGGSFQVTLAGDRIVICELNGEYFALNATCPHRGGPLGICPPENGALICPMHGWKFDIRTGICAERPDRPATTYAVRVVDGEIQLKL